MTHYLLDTNHAGSLLRGNSPLPGKMLAAMDADFGLCVPSIGELWHMIFKTSQPAANEQKLQTMIGQFIVYPFDQTAARQFGRVVTELRRIGRPIPPIDMQIAAIALANDLILLTADRHFDHVAGLKHENWI